MGFGNHFIADDIEHGSSRKGQSKGENGRSNAYGPISQKRTDDFDQPGHHGADKGFYRGYACCQHGRNDHHAFGDVLQGDTAGDHHRLRRVFTSKADTGGNPLRQVMDRDGCDKQQYLVKVGAAVCFRIGSHQPMQVGNQLINEIQAHRPSKDPDDGNEDPMGSAIIERWQNQSQYSRRQHNTCRKGQHYVGEFVGDIPKDKANETSKNGRAPNAEGGDIHALHDQRSRYSMYQKVHAISFLHKFPRCPAPASPYPRSGNSEAFG